MGSVNFRKVATSPAAAVGGRVFTGCASALCLHGIVKTFVRANKERPAHPMQYACASAAVIKKWKRWHSSRATRILLPNMKSDSSHRKQ